MIETAIYKCENCGNIELETIKPTKMIICPKCDQIMKKLEDDFDLCEITEVTES